MSRPLLRPELYLDALRHRPRLGSNAVLVFDSSAVPKRGRLKRPSPFRAIAPMGESSAVVLAAGPGGPTAAVTIELLAQLGVDSIVTVGLAASLRPDQNVGEPVVPVAAISDEGVSSRYGGHLLPDPELATKLTVATGAITGATVSIDTPFRHDAHRIAELSEAAVTLEMECAAIFAASNHLGIRSAAILVVSDHLLSSGWLMGDRAVTAPAMANLVTTASNVLEATP